MVEMVGGEAKVVVEALAAKESRGPEEVATEVVGEAAEAEADAAAVAAAMAMVMAMAVEAGSRPTIAMKNSLL